MIRNEIIMEAAIITMDKMGEAIYITMFGNEIDNELIRSLPAVNAIMEMTDIIMMTNRDFSTPNLNKMG